jgi:hypothetical protein
MDLWKKNEKCRDVVILILFIQPKHRTLSFFIQYSFPVPQLFDVSLDGKISI